LEWQHFSACLSLRSLAVVNRIFLLGGQALLLLGSRREVDFDVLGDLGRQLNARARARAAFIKNGVTSGAENT
jgi:hypothetical protein